MAATSSPITCSADYTVLQQTLIQDFNRCMEASRTLNNPQSRPSEKIQANRNFPSYVQSLEKSLVCMIDYLNSHQVNPQQDFNQLRNTYYNVIVPMRQQIENSRNEAQNLHGKGDAVDHRYDMEKQNYNATVYIYIMMTILATVLLYYVLLNIVR
jgi:hypothetical protein